MGSAIPQLLAQADYLGRSQDQLDFASDLILTAAAICQGDSMSRTNFLRNCKILWDHIEIVVKRVEQCSSVS